MWTGKNYVVAWIDVQSCGCLISPAPPPRVRVFATRLDRDGRPLDAQPLALTDQTSIVSSLAVTLYDRFGTKLVNADTLSQGRSITLRAGRNRVSFSIRGLHLNPGIYTMPVVLERVRAHGDLHAAMLTKRQSLSKALKKL